ncbi:MAG: hydroxymethylbilane synthase [Acidimicrobiales bacterium]
MADRALRLATRGSPLARWQAGRVADLLVEAGCRPSLVVVETDGDRRADVPIDRIGGQGVFVKEVQAAVARGDADAAVHSAKDLPAGTGASPLVLAAVPERADPRDLLVGGALDSLPAGATVATGSARRRAQLANLRPDLTFTGLRGNLATRLAAVGTRGIAAVMVAKAAVDRLDWRPPDGMQTEVLEPDIMVPQVGQGALAVECRPGDDATRSRLEAVHDVVAGPPVAAERAYLAALGGGCTLPVGAYAAWTTEREEPGGREEGSGGRVIQLRGMIASGDGRVVLRHTRSGTDPEALGREVARYLLEDAGGRDLGEWVPAPGEVMP